MALVDFLRGRGSPSKALPQKVIEFLMFIEFKCPPEVTREMAAVDIQLYMKMLSAYKAITGSEQNQAIKGLLGK
jgi:hypothetical protein